jgi:hypothetical protein
VTIDQRSAGRDEPGDTSEGDVAIDQRSAGRDEPGDNL